MGIRTGKGPDRQVGYSSQKNMGLSRGYRGFRAAWPVR